MTQDEYLDRRFDDIDLPMPTARVTLARSLDLLPPSEELVGRRRDPRQPEPKPCRRDEESEHEPQPLG